EVSQSLPAAAHELTAEQRELLRRLMPFAGDSLGAEELQKKIYELSKEIGVANPVGFAAVYLAFIGKPRGPQAGRLLASLDGGFDAAARLPLRPGAGGLSVDDRLHLLRRFFSISHQQVVHRIPDYARLHNLRLAAGDRPDLLSSSYFRDLAAWFNLAWIDPELLTIDDRLVRLRDRGRNFSRDDLQYILSRHRNMASGVVRLYHRLQKAGQVEVVTVPAYHPILPLIIDSDVARHSDPNAVLPQPPFRWPEDAAAH